MRDRTGSGDIGHVHATGFPVYGFVFYGAAYVNGGFANVTSAANNAFTPTSWNVKAKGFNLRKSWNVTNLIGPGDREAEWGWEKPSIQGAFSAVATDSGPDYTTSSVALTLKLDTVGTVAGTALIPHDRGRYYFGRWRESDVAGSFVFDGAVTHTPETAVDSVDWLLNTAANDPPECTATIALTNGDTISHTVIVHAYELAYETNGGNGGIPVIWQCLFQKAPA
jgi:hypothetical protein